MRALYAYNLVWTGNIDWGGAYAKVKSVALDENPVIMEPDRARIYIVYAADNYTERSGVLCSAIKKNATRIKSIFIQSVCVIRVAPGFNKWLTIFSS